MSNPSNVIQGESYFAKVYEAVPDYNEKQSPGRQVPVGNQRSC